MANHLQGKRVVNPILTTVARGYKNAAFIGEKIFPIVEMEKEGATVPTFGNGVFAVYETKRAVGADSNVMIREKTGSVDIVLDEHDLAVPVDYRESAESIFDEEAKATRRATNGILLRREVYAAALAQDAKIYKSNAKKAFTAADCWANGQGDPLRDVETHMDAVRNNVGLRPNIITMGASVMTLLKFHPVIQAAIGANERKIITTDILKELFGVDEIVVGNPVSLGKDGKTADLWKDNLMGHYVTPPQGGATSADENEPSFGYTFRRKGMPVIDQYDAVGGKVHHCRYTDIYKVVVVGSDAGFLLSGLKGGA
ncbi:hypothetical protein FG485_21130 [Salmonella enterica subsp. enterica serovar Typhimurium]|uniref:hypothetical protein n=1 Tax=Escherichia fergusonii TaxID=564 RepID=UPI0011101C99|nr:hypothetical protein [Escherichia fergusonii]QMB01778.1 hypothetical protein HV012_12565 [Escherichia fergusonii]QMB10747.1 hypothetical protein HV010_12555 [Escherichia fergusonii]QMC64645.1 hypothetical protein HVZ69_12810 [Escherichia fergusonii]TMX21852.1 hypothetical protein FG485_21130 [Salmonella enterica subsp. enterica serovar Typhimurium]